MTRTEMFARLDAIETAISECKIARIDMNGSRATHELESAVTDLRAVVEELVGRTGNNEQTWTRTVPETDPERRRENELQDAEETLRRLANEPEKQRTFTCVGPCWKCGHGCNLHDQSKVPPAPMPPLHEGCVCYVVEESDDPEDDAR